MAGSGDGSPISEGTVVTIRVNDTRLLADPDGKLLRDVPSIVELASRKSVALGKTAKTRDELLAYVKKLVAPREEESDLQRARTNP